MTIQLTPEDHEAILAARPLKAPSETGIFVGARFLLSVKRCGEMEPVTVTCRSKPYTKRFKDGRTATYVDVFGWGVRDSVNITKLREMPAWMKEVA